MSSIFYRTMQGDRSGAAPARSKLARSASRLLGVIAVASLAACAVPAEQPYAYYPVPCPGGTAAPAAPTQVTPSTAMPATPPAAAPQCYAATPTGSVYGYAGDGAYADGYWDDAFWGYGGFYGGYGGHFGHSGWGHGGWNHGGWHGHAGMHGFAGHGGGGFHR